MKRYREFMKDSFFVKLSFFIIFTSTILYIAFFVVKDYEKVFSLLSSGISSISNALSPLWIGIILAYLLNPLVNTVDNNVLKRIIPNKVLTKLDEKDSKASRFISIFITYILILAIFIALVYTLTSLLLGQVSFGSFDETVSNLKNFVESYEDKFQWWISNIPQGVFSEQLQNAANSIVRWFASIINADAVLSLVAGVGGQLFNFFMGVILSIYLISDKEFFATLWNRVLYLFAPQKGKSIAKTLNEANEILSKFIRGVLLDSSIIGLLMILGLSLVKVEFALFLGIFAGLTNVIPYFGPFIGMIPAFTVAVFTDGIWKGVTAVVVMFIIQQIDSNITYPRIVGSSIGLRPMFVLLSILVFGYYMGIIGMIIAVPVTSIFQLLLGRWADSREEKLHNLKYDVDETKEDEEDILDNIL